MKKSLTSLLNALKKPSSFLLTLGTAAYLYFSNIACEPTAPTETLRTPHNLQQLFDNPVVENGFEGLTRIEHKTGKIPADSSSIPEAFRGIEYVEASWEPNSLEYLGKLQVRTWVVTGNGRLFQYDLEFIKEPDCGASWISTPQGDGNRDLGYDWLSKVGEFNLTFFASQFVYDFMKLEIDDDICEPMSPFFGVEAHCWTPNSLTQNCYDGYMLTGFAVPEGQKYILRVRIPGAFIYTTTRAPEAQSPVGITNP